jgi:hypothetical protein
MNLDIRGAIIYVETVNLPNDGGQSGDEHGHLRWLRSYWIVAVEKRGLWGTRCRGKHRRGRSVVDIIYYEEPDCLDPYLYRFPYLYVPHSYPPPFRLEFMLIPSPLPFPHFRVPSFLFRK